MKQSVLKTYLYRIVISLMPFVVLSVMTKVFFNDVYLPEWLVRHSYCGLWIVVMMIAPLHFRLSLFISLVNAASMILGQMIGDAMQSYNIAKITPDMSAEMQVQMHNHYGFVIWAGCLAVSVMLYLLWFHIRKKSSEYNK